MKEESTGTTESDTRRQLREKIASLSRLQLERASDTLAMIWNGMINPPELPAPQPKPVFSANSILSRQVQLALLRSISTGVFIDFQFYAYNAVHDGVPVDLKPLFTSSIVVEEWAPAISTRKSENTSENFPTLTRREDTVGVESQAACLMDGLADDYEYWHGEHPEALHKGKTVMYVLGLWVRGSEVSHMLLRKHYTEASAAVESREAVVLMSGAWKT